MQTDLKYLKTGNFSSILENIHEEIRQKVNSVKEDRRAEQIETILKTLKKTVRIMYDEKSNSGIKNLVNDRLRLLITETIDEQMNLRKKNKAFNLKDSTLFQRSHKTHVSDTKKFDDIFEEEFAALIAAAAKIEKININIDTVAVGPNSTEINKLSKSLEKLFVNISNQALHKQAQKLNVQDSPITNIKANTGKVDTSVPELHVQASLKDDIIQRFLIAISGATFSLKNYKSVSWATDKKTKKRTRTQKPPYDIQFHLGSTNPYKAITATLSEIFSDPRAQNRIYYRGMVILTGRSKPEDTATPEEILQHFSHLRFIYELRGKGIIDNTQKQAADFLIWNDPTSDNIVVRSTSSIIKQYWEQYSNYIYKGDIDLSASRLLKTKKT